MKRQFKEMLDAELAVLQKDTLYPIYIQQLVHEATELAFESTAARDGTPRPCGFGPLRNSHPDIFKNKDVLKESIANVESKKSVVYIWPWPNI